MRARFPVEGENLAAVDRVLFQLLHVVAGNTKIKPLVDAHDCFVLPAGTVFYIHSIKHHYGPQLRYPESRLQLGIECGVCEWVRIRLDVSEFNKFWL